MKIIYNRHEWKDIIKAMGLVFGDIGTSPIYTLSVIFLLIKPTPENVLGIISLIIWTLIILVTVEYVFLAMKLDSHGEGGTLILKKLLDETIPKGRKKTIIGIIAFIGVSLLLGDGVITPSISILSAVEGMRLIPHFENISQTLLMGTGMTIAVALFIFQSKGTDKVAGTFGPIMIIWFTSLALFGVYSITISPSIIKAINPYYAVMFFYNHGIIGIIMLSQVILCATGAEALYADMGHLGRKPMTRAWHIVFVALILNYIGQGAYVLREPGATNFLFGMVNSIMPVIYIPFLTLTVLATVIASQALISGVFSIIYQGISSGVFPRMKINFTSNILKSQIYIPFINWCLMVLVIFMMGLFEKSDNLAVAYGLAVTGTMCTTGIMMIMIFKKRKRYFLFAVSILVTVIDFIFLAANMYKLPHGGYWSIIIASFPFMLIMLWTNGNKSLFQNLRPMPLETFLQQYKKLYVKKRNIPGTALYFISSPQVVSPYIVHNVTRCNILYQKNIFISISKSDEPYGIIIDLSKPLSPGLYVLKIVAGYKEDLDIGRILGNIEIDPKVIFYGVEDIATSNPVWTLFSAVRRLSPSFVKFYKVPSSKLHGIITRIEM